jgi:two-component system response regulator (stage 0 sporulation protein A)
MAGYLEKNAAIEENIRILLVDDSKNYCEVLSGIINQKEGVEVVGVAHDGLRAVELIHELKPDVVLLDVVMPLLDGIGVLEKFSNVEDKPKFIMLTGVGQEEVIYRTFELGVSFFILKPFDHNLLVDRIKEFTLNGNKDSAFKKKKVEADLNSDVTSMMHELGIPVHIKGYHFLRESIVRSCEDKSLLGALTKELYPKIALEFNTTPSKVERSIRNAIKLACIRGNTEMINNLFQFSVRNKQGKPTNGQFISTIVDRILSNEKSNQLQ